MKIGDRVKAIDSGRSSRDGFRCDRVMRIGERGVITKLDNNEYYEILLDSGEYITRHYFENVKVIQEKSSEPQYEIY